MKKNFALIKIEILKAISNMAVDYDCEFQQDFVRVYSYDGLITSTCLDILCRIDGVKLVSIVSDYCGLYALLKIERYGK